MSLAPTTLAQARAIGVLPPQSQPGEIALEAALRMDPDFASVGTLWNPATCPAEVLPFLAWGLAISHWNPDWTEGQKRTAVAGAIPFHRKKGTRAAVEEVLARFHPLLSITEWWQTTPAGDPHTFEVRAPAAIPASFLTAETAEAIIRDVAAAKPLRSHFTFVQLLELQAAVWISGGMMVGSEFRSDADALHDTSRDWSLVLQTEDGEPILAEDGVTFLETA